VGREPTLARRFFDRFEPVHAVTYFSPEARAASDGLGFRGFWMGYFATRSAPLGVVPTAVVAAMFYNFSADRITDAGRNLKQRIEETTDELALSALDGLTDDELERLFRTLTPITRMVDAHLS
jgi:hypothetical protein